MKQLIALILSIVIVLSVVVAIISLSKETPTEISTINYTFTVTDKISFNLDTDKLNFGGGFEGATLQRRMNVSAPYDARVHIESVGPGNLISNINDFSIKSGSSQEVTFSLLVPGNLPPAKYEGQVFFYFYQE